MLHNYVDQVVVLTQRSRVDRRYLFDQQAQDQGLQYHYFYSIEDADPKRSFNLSHKAILTQFCDEMFQQLKKQGIDDFNNKTILVLEDDADLRNLEYLNDRYEDGSVAQWDNALSDYDFSIINQLPDDWDILYLGANVKPTPDFIPPKRVGKNVFRIFNAYTTHAIIYRLGAAQWIKDLYDGEMMYDAWLDTQLKFLNAYICCPFLSYQRPTRSDLWDRNVDYTDTFQASENYLNSIV
jgi:hypothetical protein